MRAEYLIPDLDFAKDRKVLFERFFEALDDLSEEGVDFVETLHEESATQIKTRFSDDEDRSHIQIWEDYVGLVRYLEIASDDTRRLGSMREALASHFEFLDHGALLSRAREGQFADPRMLYQIAYSAPDRFTQATFEAICEAMDSNHPAVREAAAAVAGLLGWKDFFPILVRHERQEPPGPAKRSMRDALRMFGVGA